MIDSYNINDIILGTPSRASGHEAYLGALYQSPADGKSSKIICKMNKHGRPELSRMEVTFSKLAQLFLAPGTTSFQKLVVNDQKQILGVATQHLCYVIAEKEGLQKQFYALNRKSGWKPVPASVTDVSEIPIHFFDKLPQGTMANLRAEEKAGRLTIDYASLADILGTSLVLEEDDIHRGNYGFYLVDKGGKPEVVFFKIDHDLMFVNSIMGFYTRRPFHWFHGAHAFDFAAGDLLSLVHLKSAAHAYWPTKFSYIANPFDNKEYHSYADIKAFSQMGSHPEFIKAKWKSFLKHILMPEGLIKQTLDEGSDRQNAADRAHSALMNQVVLTRISQLRAVLFSIKDFRDFVGSLSSKDEDIKTLLQEVIPPHLITEDLLAQTKDSFLAYKKHCLSEAAEENTNKFTEEDTPLHTAIKLGEYRYEESLSMFGHQFINTKNKEGKTPLDVALEQVNSAKADSGDVRQDARYIMQHLLKNGAKKTQAYKDAGLDAEISAHTFKSPYVEQITKATSYKRMKCILSDIGEDHRFSLKFKKDLAYECIKRFITVYQDHDQAEEILRRFKKEINNSSSEGGYADMRYIRQLRSELWIVRQIRGLYGMTSTQRKINDLMDQTLGQIKANKAPSGCFPFFSRNKGKEEERVEWGNKMSLQA